MLEDESSVSLASKMLAEMFAVLRQGSVQGWSISRRIPQGTGGKQGRGRTWREVQAWCKVEKEGSRKRRLSRGKMDVKHCLLGAHE